MAAVLLLAGSGWSCMPPEWGAEAVLRPQRRAVEAVPDIAYDAVSFSGADGIVLRGWRFRASGERRGVLVYLHGSGDNRRVGSGSRSGSRRRDGTCSPTIRGRTAAPVGVRAPTVFSRRETCEGARRGRGGPGRPVRMFARRRGSAAGRAARRAHSWRDRADQFSSLEEIARDRAPWFATRARSNGALTIAGSKGGFDPAAASPLASAPRIRIPVLLVHGEPTARRSWCTAVGSRPRSRARRGSSSSPVRGTTTPAERAELGLGRDRGVAWRPSTSATVDP